MKKKLCLFLAILCLFLSSLSAQTNDSSGRLITYMTEQDSLFAPLDKSRMPHGTLYDRVFPFAQLNRIASGDSVSAELWIQGLSELQRATYGFQPADSLLTYENARDFIYSENVQGRLPLVVLHAPFATIDSAAYTDGRLVKGADSLWHDGPNTASPYTDNLVSFAALGTLRPLLQDSAYKLYLTGGYDFGAATAVTGVTVQDLTEGTTYEFTDGAEQVVQFQVVGVHLLDITVMREGEAPLHFKQQIAVRSWQRIAGSDCQSPITPIQGQYGFIGNDEPANTYPYGVGEYQIFYRTNEPCGDVIKKPIIIVDAWDPGDHRKIENFYRPGNDNERSKLRYTTSSGPRQNVCDLLRPKGYDIIILNFPADKTIIGSKQVVTWSPVSPHINLTTVSTYRDGGADYIERNGYILVSLIETIKAKMAVQGQNEKMVVVGPSMGGQISRYALRWMEQHNKDPRTRLWVSFDSPHWGANISYGLQTLIQGLAQKFDNEGAKATYQNQLRAPAARQMLIHQAYPDQFTWYLGGTALQQQQTNVHLYINNSAPERIGWRLMLNNIGYPQTCRKISLTNGSRLGGEYHAPGSKMFMMIAQTNQSGQRLADASAYFMNSTNSLLAEAFRLNTHFVTPALSWYTYDQMFSRVDKTSLVYGPLDGAPGGLYDVQQDFYDGLTGANLTGDNNLSFAGIKLGEQRFRTVDTTHNMTFIPLPSALGINDPAFKWTDPMNVGDLLCQQKTPFDNIYIPDQNQNHITLTQDNVNWLMSELEAPQITAPASPLSPSKPAATPMACARNLYSIPGLPSTATVSWSVSGQLQITSTSGSDVWIRPNYAGATGTITAIVTPDPSKCVSYTATITTTGTTDRTYSLGFTGLPNCNWQAAVSPVISGDSYAWNDGTVTNGPNGPVKIYTSGGSTYYPSYFPTGYVAPPATPLHVYAIVTTGCVSAGAVSLNALFNNTADACSSQNTGGGGSTYRQASATASDGLTVFPNPTTSDWLLVMNGTAAQKIEAVLTDAVGRTVWSQTVSDGSGSFPPIPGAGLNSGMYFLTVRIDGRSRQFKLVKH